MTSIRPVGGEDEPMILDESTKPPRSALAGHADDRGADGYREVLQSWLVDANAPYRRTRRSGKHIRRRGED